MSNTTANLPAILNGDKIRTTPMPARCALGQMERKAIDEVVTYYTEIQQDMPYDGIYKQKLCKEFAEYMGGGYADAVNTGTAAVYTALAALDLPKGSEVIISPVTDSGPLNCIIMQGYIPVIADAKENSYNTSLEKLLEKTTIQTSCYLLIHAGGEPMDDIMEVVNEAHNRGIKVLEDCSQAIGSTLKDSDQKIGTYGDIAAFSTMYRKNLISGSSGGLVFSRNEHLRNMAIAHANRGRELWRTDIEAKDPSHALFPALNFNTNEISCAICSASLKRLDESNGKRAEFLVSFIQELEKKSKVCKPSNYHNGFAPFFFPVFVDVEKLTCTKTEFANALIAEGISLNPHFTSVISMWEWARKYTKHEFALPNAESMRDRSFNLFLNENYGKQEIDDIINAIVKLENYYQKE